MWLRPKILVTRSRTYLKPHIFSVFVWTGPKTQAWCCARGAGGGGDSPYDGLYGEAPPGRGIFFRLEVYERVAISLVEVYTRVGRKSVIWVCERAQKG